MLNDKYFEYSVIVGLFVGLAADNTMAGLAGGVILGFVISIFHNQIKKKEKTNSTSRRLEELEMIKSKDLINESEYQAKKEEILKEL